MNDQNESKRISADEIVEKIALALAPLPAIFNGGRKSISINMAASDKAKALIEAYRRATLEAAAERAIKWREWDQDEYSPSTREEEQERKDSLRTAILNDQN